MNIIGISAFYHDAACCLLQDGEIAAAASEERFTRVKYDPRLPVNAFRFCLDQAGLAMDQLDCVAYYELPEKKLERQLWSRLPADGGLQWLDPGLPERAIRERLGWDGPIERFAHHASHAASAYYFSGFDDAAVLVADGVGEWAATSYGRARGAELTLFEQVDFPHSLGLLYATLTAFLGFRVNDGEYKVMGLAPYGRPKYADRIRSLIEPGPGGQYRLDMSCFDFVNGRRMFTDKLSRLLGGPPRKPEAPIEPFHQDVARSLQLVLEETLLAKIQWLAGQVDSPNLCMAGGVALNCVANGRLLREGPFQKLFVQPAAGDAGGCLGAAALAHLRRAGDRPRQKRIERVRWGPCFSHGEIAALIDATGVKAQCFAGDEAGLIEAAVSRLVRREVIGWHQGGMEFGPRALGGRSILANPLDPEARDRVNALVKKRESFRPFAPSVLEREAAAHFDLDHPSPFMLETCQTTSPLAIPGAVHVDGSARPQTVSPEQNPRFAALLEAFYRASGCPMLVNTSFNVRGEPIVCTPVDALYCMSEANLDALVIGDFIIDRRDLPAAWKDLAPAWRRRETSAFAGKRSAIHENLYSFV